MFFFSDCSTTSHILFFSIISFSSLMMSLHPLISYASEIWAGFSNSTLGAMCAPSLHNFLFLVVSSVWSHSIISLDIGTLEISLLGKTFPLPPLKFLHVNFVTSPPLFSVTSAPVFLATFFHSHSLRWAFWLFPFGVLLITKTVRELLHVFFG